MLQLFRYLAFALGCLFVCAWGAFSAEDRWLQFFAMGGLKETNWTLFGRKCLGCWCSWFDIALSFPWRIETLSMKDFYCFWCVLCCLIEVASDSLEIQSESASYHHTQSGGMLLFCPQNRFEFHVASMPFLSHRSSLQAPIISYLTTTYHRTIALTHLSPSLSSLFMEIFCSHRQPAPKTRPCSFARYSATHPHSL